MKLFKALMAALLVVACAAPASAQVYESKSYIKKTSKTTKTVTRKQTGDQLQNLSNGVGPYKESTAQLTAVKSDLDEIQLQMDKVMLAQG